VAAARNRYERDPQQQHRQSSMVQVAVDAEKSGDHEVFILTGNSGSVLRRQFQYGINKFKSDTKVLTGREIGANISLRKANPWNLLIENSFVRL
jgi:hypothetical protein